MSTERANRSIDRANEKTGEKKNTLHEQAYFDVEPHKIDSYQSFCAIFRNWWKCFKKTKFMMAIYSVLFSSNEVKVKNHYWQIAIYKIVIVWLLLYILGWYMGICDKRLLENIKKNNGALCDDTDRKRQPAIWRSCTHRTNQITWACEYKDFQ